MGKPGREWLRTWPDRPHPWVILAAVFIVLSAVTAGLLRYIADTRAAPPVPPGIGTPVLTGPRPPSHHAARTHSARPSPPVTQPAVTVPQYSAAYVPPASPSPSRSPSRSASPSPSLTPSLLPSVTPDPQPSVPVPSATVPPASTAPPGTFSAPAPASASS